LTTTPFPYRTLAVREHDRALVAQGRVDGLRLAIITVLARRAELRQGLRGPLSPWGLSRLQGCGDPEILGLWLANATTASSEAAVFSEVAAPDALADESQVSRLAIWLNMGRIIRPRARERSADGSSTTATTTLMLRRAVPASGRATDEARDARFLEVLDWLGLVVDLVVSVLPLILP